MKDNCLALLVVGMLTGPTVANATEFTYGALSSNDDGNAHVIYDSRNNLEWLRWDQLQELTYAQTLEAIGTGGAYEGWQIAGIAEAQLFADALLQDSGTLCDINNDYCEVKSLPDNLMGLFGDSYASLPAFTYAWFLSDNDVDQEVGVVWYQTCCSGVIFGKYNESLSISESDRHSSIGDLGSENSIGWLLFRPAAPISESAWKWPVPIAPGASLVGQDYGMFNLGKAAHHHTGVDISATLVDGRRVDTPVRAVADGNVVAVCPNQVRGGCVFAGKRYSNNAGNHGLQGVVILQHSRNGETVYSLYGHLRDVNSDLQFGEQVAQGDLIGRTGAAPSGDRHLHLEVKSSPVLHNPNYDVDRVAANCRNNSVSSAKCWGYVYGNPSSYGYFDPVPFFHEVLAPAFPVEIQVSEIIDTNGAAYPPRMRKGPGGLMSGLYMPRMNLPSGTYWLIGQAVATESPVCPEGWYQIARSLTGDCRNVSDCIVTNQPRRPEQRQALPDGWVCGSFVH